VTVSRTRVALAEDDVLLREGLASLLERSGWIRRRRSRGTSIPSCGPPFDTIAVTAAGGVNVERPAAGQREHERR